MTIYLRSILLFYMLVCVIPQTIAQNINITLAQQNIRLTYNQNVRLSQILTDAYPYVDHEIYSLGVALVNPDKQAIIEAKKTDVFEALKQLNTLEANNLLNQLSSSRFLYRESIETNINKVRFFIRSNPLIKEDHFLFLPSRPDHITLFNSAYEKPLLIPLKTNYHLKSYLEEQPNNPQHKHHKAWVIQANKDFYLATDIQWQRTLYYLAPGAYVFIGLTNLPKSSTLNADIAELLTFYLEP